MREIWEQHGTAIQIVGIMVLIVLIATLGIYYNSSSVTKVPKADAYSEESKEAHTESVVQEKEADIVAEEVKAVEGERQSAKVQAARAKARIVYVPKEKIVIVRSDDLDARERQLLTNLEGLYTVR